MMAPVCPRIAPPKGFRLAISHSLTVLSALAVARVLPSGLKATALIARTCPLSGSPKGSPLATSQSRAKLLAPIVARVLPSGLKAIE